MSKAQAPNFKASTLFMRFLYWCGVILICWFAYLNVSPYALLVKELGGKIVDASFINLMYALPLIGAFLKSIGTASHWLIGFVIWVIIQSIECFPIILKRHKGYMRAVLEESQNAHKFAISAGDDPAIAALKKWYNHFPLLSIRNARTAANFTYAIDMVVCLAIFPPCDGGVAQLLFIFATGQFQLIDYKNVALLIITLFAVEQLLKLLFWWGQTIYYFKKASAK